MPISNNFIEPIPGSGGNIIDLTGLSGLNTSYRYFKEGFYKLEPNKPLIIVPATPSKVNREIVVNYLQDSNLNNTSNINLYWGSKNPHPKQIELDGGYIDTSDGGIALIADCSQTAIVEVTIRQDTEINYTIGNYWGEDEMPVELIIRPLIETGTLYSMPNMLPVNSIGEANLRTLIDSNNGLTSGVKVWAIDQFQPGKVLDFTINFGNGVIGNSRKIIINLTPTEILLKAFASLEAAQTSELDEAAIPKDLIGWVKLRSYYKEIDPINGSVFQLKPSHTRFILSFDCENPTTPGYTDTIISTYQKNLIDPYQGGTFTFLGF